MGYYRQYYEGRTYIMAMVKHTGGAGQESIWLMEDNTCKCDSCVECDCDPSVCRCECHKDKNEVFKHQLDFEQSHIKAYSTDVRYYSGS